MAATMIVVGIASLYPKAAISQPAVPDHPFVVSAYAGVGPGTWTGPAYASGVEAWTDYGYIGLRWVSVRDALLPAYAPTSMIQSDTDVAVLYGWRQKVFRNVAVSLATGVARVSYVRRRFRTLGWHSVDSVKQVEHSVGIPVDLHIRTYTERRFGGMIGVSATIADGDRYGGLILALFYSSR